MHHTPVLLQESLEALAIDPEGTYVDLTFGGGGHTQAILQQLQGGRLLAFDQDPAAAAVAQELVDARFTFIQANARFMQQFLTFHGVTSVDGILADLGVSSYQIDTAARGFSTRWEGMLDMRMNPESDLTAHDIVNTYTAEQLQQLFQDYGEVRNARTVAKAIVAARAVASIHTTQDLRNILRRWAPSGRAAKYYLPNNLWKARCPLLSLPRRPACQTISTGGQLGRGAAQRCVRQSTAAFPTCVQKAGSPF